VPIPRTVSRLRHRLRVRLRDERGFGLVELLAALVVLAVGILAVFAMFESGIRQIGKASTVTTAGALADKEMESYRAIKYASIGLPDTLLPTTPPYTTDTAYSASSLARVNLLTCGIAPCTNKIPVQTVTGADGKSYRLDTYVTWQTVGAGRQVKLVTVVVRDGADTSKVWARAASAFDRSTGE
jgi:prepilin-type N-terminal cleavage/methylation domain-containing protein